MAQVNLTQYAEIILSDGRPIRIGSKTIPSTIALAGTGEVFHRIWNDNANWPLELYDSNITTGTLKFIAVKSSIDATFGYGKTVAGGNNSTIPLEAGVWLFISGGGETNYVANVGDRTGETVDAITYMAITAGASADIELIVAY